MVTETVISTFLEASITGAGLVLAIYALMTPISRKIFQERAKKLDELLREFEAEKVKITADSTKKDYKKLKTLSNEIKEYKNFPKYLGIGIIFSFMFFMLEIMVDWAVLIFPPPSSNMATGAFFIVGVISFLCVGFFAIFEILGMMLKEFEATNKRRKQAEKTAKTIINS
jgi:hypothetical protein